MRPLLQAVLLHAFFTRGPAASERGKLLAGVLTQRDAHVGSRFTGHAFLLLSNARSAPTPHSGSHSTNAARVSLRAPSSRWRNADFASRVRTRLRTMATGGEREEVFRTVIQPREYPFKIALHDKLSLMGSCFSVCRQLSFSVEPSLRQDVQGCDHTTQIDYAVGLGQTNIGERLRELKFDIDINPFGISYSPLSLAWVQSAPSTLS